MVSPKDGQGCQCHLNSIQQSSQVWSFPKSEILGGVGSKGRGVQGGGSGGMFPQKTFEICTSQICSSQISAFYEGTQKGSFQR